MKKIYKSLIAALLIINMALPSFASAVNIPLPLPETCIKNLPDFSVNALKIRQSLLSQFLLGELDEAIYDGKGDDCYWLLFRNERVNSAYLTQIENFPSNALVWYSKLPENEKQDPDRIKAIKDEYNFPQAYIEIKNQARLIIKIAAGTRQRIADLEQRYLELVNGTYDPSTSQLITGLFGQDQDLEVLYHLKITKDYYKALKEMYYGMAKYYRGLKELEALVASYENPTTGLNSVTTPSQGIVDLSTPSSVPVVRPVSGLSTLESSNTGLCQVPQI